MLFRGGSSTDVPFGSARNTGFEPRRGCGRLVLQLSGHARRFKKFGRSFFDNAVTRDKNRNWILGAGPHHEPGLTASQRPVIWSFRNGRVEARKIARLNLMEWLLLVHCNRSQCPLACRRSGQKRSCCAQSEFCRSCPIHDMSLSPGDSVLLESYHCQATDPMKQ